jgi:F-type H+-transporting ATPase subunit epsilon
MSQLKINIVTPESTTLDKQVDAVTLPLIDGEAGVLPGHAPMIGRLGPGELRVRSGSIEERFYVDGGFVQIENNQVSVLTGRSLPADKIDVVAAREALAAAEAEPTDKPELAELRHKAIAQAQAQIRMAEKA